MKQNKATADDQKQAWDHKADDLGEAIIFWISQHGYLDLDTSQEDIIDYFIQFKLTK